MGNEIQKMFGFFTFFLNGKYKIDIQENQCNYDVNTRIYNVII